MSGNTTRRVYTYVNNNNQSPYDVHVPYIQSMSKTSEVSIDSTILDECCNTCEWLVTMLMICF